MYINVTRRELLEICLKNRVERYGIDYKKFEVLMMDIGIYPKDISIMIEGNLGDIWIEQEVKIKPPSVEEYLKFQGKEHELRTMVNESLEKGVVPNIVYDFLEE